MLNVPGSGNYRLQHLFCISRPYSAVLSFPPRGVTETSCYCFEYNLHHIKIPSHLNRESIYTGGYFSILPLSYPHELPCVLWILPNQIWREFTHIVEADTEEVAREVWAGLQDKVQRVARRESGTRKGLRELSEKQTADLPLMMNWVRTAYKLCTTIYILHVVLSF